MKLHIYTQMHTCVCAVNVHNVFFPNDVQRSMRVHFDMCDNLSVPMTQPAVRNGMFQAGDLIIKERSLGRVLTK